MATLQESLAVLLGADNEARRMVDEARIEADGLMHSARVRFAEVRKDRMDATQEQSKSLMESVLASAKAEAEQILTSGKEERERTVRRFEENADMVIASLKADLVERILSGATQ